MDAIRLSPSEKEALVSTLAVSNLTSASAPAPGEATARLHAANQPGPRKAQRHAVSRRTLIALVAAAVLAFGAAGIAVASRIAAVDVPDLIADLFSRSQVPGGPVVDGMPVYFPDNNADGIAGNGGTMGTEDAEEASGTAGPDTASTGDIAGSSADAAAGSSDDRNVGPNASATTASAGIPGATIGVSATDNGVTITADSVIGDRTSAIIVFTLAKADGSPLDELTTDSLSNAPDPLFQSTDITYGDGKRPGGSSLSSYDADPSDNAIQIVYRMSADESIVGTTVTTRFSNLAIMDERDPATDGPGDSTIRRTVIPGTWELTFALDYTDLTRDITAVGQTFASGCSQLTAASMRISPISVRVELDVRTDLERLEQSGAQVSDELYRLSHLPVFLVMRDESQVGAAFAYPGNAFSPGLSGGGSAGLDTEGNGDAQLIRYTPHIIYVNEVVAVLIDGHEIPVD